MFGSINYILIMSILTEQMHGYISSYWQSQGLECGSNMGTIILPHSSMISGIFFFLCIIFLVFPVISEETPAWTLTPPLLKAEFLLVKFLFRTLKVSLTNYLYLTSIRHQTVHVYNVIVRFKSQVFWESLLWLSTKFLTSLWLTFDTY